MGGSSETGSAGCLAFAGGGESLRDLLDRHVNHLLLAHLSRNIEKGRA